MIDSCVEWSAGRPPIVRRRRRPSGDSQAIGDRRCVWLGKAQREAMLRWRPRLGLRRDPLRRTTSSHSLPRDIELRREGGRIQLRWAATWLPHHAPYGVTTAERFDATARKSVAHAMLHAGVRCVPAEAGRTPDEAPPRVVQPNRPSPLVPTQASGPSRVGFSDPKRASTRVRGSGLVRNPLAENLCMDIAASV